MNLEDPLCAGTGFVAQEIYCPYFAGDTSLYKVTNNHNHFLSATKDDIYAAAEWWLPLFGITEEGLVCTSFSLDIADSAETATVEMDLLGFVDNRAQTTHYKGVVSAIGNHAAPEKLASYLANPTPVPLPTAWGEQAQALLDRVPGCQNALPFPSAITAQYTEDVFFGQIYAVCDGVNLATTYGPELRAHGFKVKINPKGGNQYVYTVNGGLEDHFITSSLIVELKYEAGVSTILVYDDITWKDQSRANEDILSWNNSIFNQSEEEEGYGLGLTVGTIEDSEVARSVKTQDITQYINANYSANGASLGMLFVYSDDIEVADKADAIAYGNQIVTSQIAAGLLTNSEATLEEDGYLTLLKTEENYGYGIGLGVVLMKDEAGNYDGTLSLQFYCGPAPYVEQFLLMLA